MYYLRFLEQLHARLRPETYLEIGVASGKSLRLSACRSVGIDPGYAITVPVDGDVALYRTTSDEYFGRPEPLAPTGGRPFDLAFIDGLHLFEFAFRDFIHTERYCSARSVIVFDDVLPRSVEEAARERHTKAWTGDVYPMLAVLERYRPGLCVIPVNTQPTGLLLVLGLDPGSTTLPDHYDEIMAEYRHPDPQPVPEYLIDRISVMPPERVLESGVIDLLGRVDAEMTAAEIRPGLVAAIRSSLGDGYVNEVPLGSTSN